MQLLSRTKSAAAALFAVGAFAACSDSNNPTDTGPLPPAAVTATALGATAVRVQFQPVSGATGYVIQRAPGTTGGDFVDVGTPATPTFDDEQLTPSTSYRYRAAAVRSGQTSAFSNPVVVTTSASGQAGQVNIGADITASRTLHPDTVYRLTNFVHVTGQSTVLTILPGTRIVGQPGSALFILRGARINAQGTAAAPILMTSAKPVGQRKPGDWGGLIIVGNGRLNRGDPVILEGTNTGGNNYPVNYAGGTDNADNSGVLRYVIVEFAGFGPAQDAELNTFTFAAVGSGTQFSHLHALAGLDDHYEWFGGAVDAKYLVSYESGDDHFDMSEGYVGRVQFAIAFQSRILEPLEGAGNPSNDPFGIENDGCNGANCLDGQNSQPYTIPIIANFTLVGTGPGHVDGNSGGVGMVLRRGTGGFYVNGVVARFPKGAISLRDAATQARFNAGDLRVSNVYATDVPSLFQGSSLFQIDAAANNLELGTASTASLFAAFPATTSAATTAAAFDWTPAANSPIATGGLNAFTGGLQTRAGTFITPTAYRGAADPNPASPNYRWWQGWTTYAIQ